MYLKEYVYSTPLNYIHTTHYSLLLPLWCKCHCSLGDARCTRHFKWMGENALHLKVKSCTPSALFLHSVRGLLPVPFHFLGRVFKLLSFLSFFSSLCRFLSLEVRCRHWGPATPFCCSTVEVSFFSPLTAAFSILVRCVHTDQHDPYLYYDSYD